MQSWFLDQRGNVGNFPVMGAVRPAPEQFNKFIDKDLGVWAPVLAYCIHRFATSHRLGAIKPTSLM